MNIRKLIGEANRLRQETVARSQATKELAKKCICLC